MSEGRTAKPITVEELAALNDEIIAMVRAGLPLDRGLIQAGGDLSGGLRRITSAIGERMSRGESLHAALDAEKRAIPPLYRAVVEAGAQSGRLPSALEGLARYVRGYNSARDAIGSALAYPLTVLTLAYLLFIGLVTLIIPRFYQAFDDFRVSQPVLVRWLEKAGETVGYWWFVWPVLLLLIAWAWRRSGNAATFRSSSWSLLRFVPWMGSMLRDYEAAGFAELLSLLLNHKVPYPRAVSLAADATGDPAMIQGTERFAQAIERGELPDAAMKGVSRAAFPPMLRWILSSGAEQASVVDSLEKLGPIYRSRGNFKSDKLKIFLPILLTIAIGGTATLIYGLTLFLPLSSMLSKLTTP